MEKSVRFDNVLVMGKSGAGKQSMIDVFVSEFGLEQLSTGSIFRTILGSFDKAGYKGELSEFYDSEKDEFISDEKIRKAVSSQIDASAMDEFILGLKARYYVTSGLFVPDSLTNELFRSFFAKSGYRGAVLDGYPRTLSQAEFLLDLVDKNRTGIDLILLVNNEDDIIITRTMGRRICPSCGAVYHIKNKPPKDGKFCSSCGTEVKLRSDDTEEKIRTRLNEFKTKTLPAIDFLKSKNIPVVEVPGNLPVFTEEAVRECVMNGLESANLIQGK